MKWKAFFIIFEGLSLKQIINIFFEGDGPTLVFHHSLKKRKDSLETRAELVVLLTYVKNQAILEPILLYQELKYKQTKEPGSEDCLWTHINTFL